MWIFTWPTQVINTLRLVIHWVTRTLWALPKNIFYFISKSTFKNSTGTKPPQKKLKSQPNTPFQLLAALPEEKPVLKKYFSKHLLAFTKEDLTNSTLLHYAAKHFPIKITKALIRTDLFDINAQDKKGHTPLYYVVQHLITPPPVLFPGVERYPNFSMPNIYKKKQKRHDNAPDLIQFMVEQGADVNVQYQGKSLLQDIMHYDNGDLFALFIAHGADPTHLNRSQLLEEPPLFFAIRHDLGSCIHDLLPKIHHLNSPNSHGNTPLHYAVFHGSHASITVLGQQKNLNISPKNRAGKTPLDIAIDKLDWDTLSCLLELPALRHNDPALKTLANHFNALLQQAFKKCPSKIQQRFLTVLISYGKLISPQTKIDIDLLYALRHHMSVQNLDDLLQTLVIQNQPKSQKSSTFLGQLSTHSENSMRDLNPTQTNLLTLLQDSYQDTLLRLGGVDAVLKNYLDYLEQKTKENPVRDSLGNALPHHHTELSTYKPYYQHTYHTAWRFFQSPNPWLAPDNFDDVILTILFDDNDEQKARLTAENKELLAYCWLALSDPTTQPREGFTHDSLKEEFTRHVALITRAENWQTTIDDHEEGDDLQGDKPSCQRGIPQRLLQSLLGHPIMDQQAARPLDPLIFARCFKERFISEGSSDSVFSKIKKYSLKDLETLQSALLNYMITHLGDSQSVTLEQKDVLGKLNILPSKISSFIQGCMLWFGPARINAKNKIQFQGDLFDDYKALANALSQNVAKYYFEILNEKIKSLIREKSASQKTMLLSYSKQPTPLKSCRLPKDETLMPQTRKLQQR